MRVRNVSGDFGGSSCRGKKMGFFGCEGKGGDRPERSEDMV